MPYSDQPTVTASGVEIPLLGFGTWKLEGDDARRMVREALRIGYRHIDTAWIYENEKAVGDVQRGVGQPGPRRRRVQCAPASWGSAGVVELFGHDVSPGSA